MKTSKFILPLILILTALIGRAAEQENWYLAKDWSVTESRGVYYDHNSTTGAGRIFVGRGSVWDATSGSGNRSSVGSGPPETSFRTFTVTKFPIGTTSSRRKTALPGFTIIRPNPSMQANKRICN